MNTTLTNTSVRHEHQPQLAYQQPVRRVSALDRAALHVGVALIKWGRRPHTLESRERRATRVEQYLAREERARSAERALRLTVPLH